MREVLQPASRGASGQVATADGYTTASIPEPHVGYDLAKRIVDIVGASLLLAVLAVPLAVVAVLVKLTSRGPVFFRHERCGLHGAPFQMTKFRSMAVDADAQLAELQERAARGEIAVVDAPAFKSEHDPRVTPVGRHLRRLSIDELPQLLDVLRGDMSLVGPRPLVYEEVRQLAPDVLARHAVKPGITCIWQTSGRSRVAFDERMRMDLEYVHRRSLALDVALLIKTPIAVITGDGAC